MRSHQVTIGEDLAGRTVSDDEPLREDDGAGAQLQGVRQVVGNHQHGDIEAADDVGKLAATGRVEVGGRLVEDEDLRFHRQDRGDRDATALTEGEMVRRAVEGVPHAHLPSALSTRASSRTADAQVRRSEGDVVTHRRHEQLIVRILEDDPHSPADLPQVLLAHLEPTDVNASEAAAEDAIEVQHEVVLPAPFGPSSATRSPRRTVRSTPNSA